MARLIKITAKNSEKTFRLVVGAVKKDMTLSDKDQLKATSKRFSSAIGELKKYMDEYPDDELVVSGIGFAD